MNRYLLLILLSSWSLLVTNSHGCETGVALPGHILSVERSLMANADVAFLKSYDAKSVEDCMKDCCSGKYGTCSVASFKTNVTKDSNCLHFYCLPLNKCKYLSSTSIDSFSFSSSPMDAHHVPSSKTSVTSSSSTSTTTVEPKHESSSNAKQQEYAITKEESAPFSQEQFALKNDNTTVKPRKGVDDLTPNELPMVNIPRSGIKPRKGVTIEDVPLAKYLWNNITKSKVKPRKGVGPYSSESVMMMSFTSVTPSWLQVHSTILPSEGLTTSTIISHNNDNTSNDLISALEKVFEDDPLVKVTMSSISVSPQPTSSDTIKITATSPYSILPTDSYATMSSYSAYTTSSTHGTSYDLKPSHSTVSKSEETSLQSTPALMHSSVKATEVMTYTSMPSVTSATVSQSFEPTKEASNSRLMESNDLRTEESDEESENERKYKSSMHLVLSLVFGLLVLFAVLGVIAKRIYEGWLRRHYRRMDFLIDGLYNGYG